MGRQGTRAPFLELSAVVFKVMNTAVSSLLSARKMQDSFTVQIQLANSQLFCLKLHSII